MLEPATVRWRATEQARRRRGRYPAGFEMVSREQARRLALSLPEVVEQDHHGRPSFRVAGRIFSTLWDEERMNVMLDPDGIRTVAQAHPEAVEEFWWGKRLAAATVTLARVEEDFLLDILTDAWERKAPRRLLRERGYGRWV